MSSGYLKYHHAGMHMKNILPYNND